MLFYVPMERQNNVRKALSHLREMKFEMDNSGASIVMTDRDNIQDMKANVIVCLFVMSIYGGKK